MAFSSSSPKPQTSFVWKNSSLFISLLLALVTLAVFWPVARCGFINFDDPDYVTMNPRTQAGLTAASLHWAFTSFHSSNWHPLTWISHMFDCQLYGLKPAGHHWTSLLFHILNTVLVFVVFRRMTGAPWRSGLVAALFGLHPLHVESVAWISERKDVVSAFFFLTTLWAYVHYAQGHEVQSQPSIEPSQTFSQATRNLKQKATYYALALLLFALGLMSKPMLVTLPFVLLLVDYWPLRRFDFETLSTIRPLLPLVKEKLPFFALSFASCITTFLVQRSSGAVVSLSNNPFTFRLANALVAYCRYLGKTLWPTKLAVFYPYTNLRWASLQVLACVLLLVPITVAVISAAKKRPYLLLGWLYFLGTLVPVIGLVQVGEQAWADRYTYLPLLGVFLMFSWGLAELIHWSGLREIQAVPVAGTVLLACGLLSYAQVEYWRDTKTLFRHAAAVTSDNYLAHTVIATALAEEGKLEEATEHCQTALQIAPRYPEAYNTLGNIYTKQGKYTEALASYQQALESNPNYADAYHGIGNALVKQGKYAEAEAPCRQALKCAPMHMPALFCLATALHNQGKLDEAIVCYRQLLDLDPGLFTVHRYLGNALVLKGSKDEAISQFRLALKIRPADAETRTALGMVLLDQNRIEEARVQFLEATRVQPDDPLANYQLALLHQSRKELAAAIACYRLALQARADWPEALNNLAWLLSVNADAGLRNGPEAVTLAERACQLTGYKEAVLIGTLGAAYAEAGRFNEAAQSAQKAQSLAAATGQKEIADRNQHLLELYRAKRAYHEGE